MILSNWFISTCLILFFTELVLNINSNTHTLVDQSLLFTNFCDWIPNNTSLILSDTLDCISVGNSDINLFIVFAAELVCKVLNTRCHVSARYNTASAVSLSRISHTNNISGSCLRAAFRAFSTFHVSCHISLCEMIHFSGLNINSIGSSIVIRFQDLVSLISWSIDTIDVDFPQPVGHVTKNNHLSFFKTFSLILLAKLLNIISSNFLAFVQIFLITTPILQVFR
jgi:hypothetical protein